MLEKQEEGEYLGNTIKPRRYRNTDYSKHMPNLDFVYDEDYYPLAKDVPDPQIDPVIPGARVPLNKVGVRGVPLPIKLYRRDGTIQELQAVASLYGSLDDPNAKGLNLSRFPITMTEEITNHLSIDGLSNVLRRLRSRQGTNSAFCKLKFSYPWIQEALRSRQQLFLKDFDNDIDKLKSSPDFFLEDDGKFWSTKKAWGHIFYDCELEGQLHNDEVTFFLTLKYVYSSTCPCSTELTYDAREKRGKAANAHSQRSIATVKIQFDPSKKIVFIEDLVELMRQQIPTEVQIFVRRIDEQAQAELNGSNLLFSEDAARLIYQGLDDWFNQGIIQDFSIVVDHMESLHPWEATAVVSKGIPNGLR